MLVTARAMLACALKHGMITEIVSGGGDVMLHS